MNKGKYENDWHKYEEALLEWDYNLNNCSPYDFSIGSSRKAQWRCRKCSNVWSAEIRSRIKVGTGCPYCSHRRLLTGYNDLQTVHPWILDEWDYEKNSKSPSQITSNSPSRVWWKCKKCNGSWKCSLCDRVTRHTKCPYCSMHKVLKGYNDFATKHPELLSEWDCEKNTVKPGEVIANGGNKTAWWKCRYGHRWNSKIQNRVKGTGCPFCAKRKHSSFPEQAIVFYLKKVFPDLINSHKDIFSNGMELDIFLPSLRIGIEYDGLNWHKRKISTEREKKKYSICRNNNITLIRIRENLPKTSEEICDVTIESKFDRINYSDLDIAIRELNDILGVVIDIDTRRDSMMIKSQYLSHIKENSLAYKYPKIAKQWHPTRNGILKPDMFEFGSIENVWWVCEKCGGEWRTTINLRTNQNTGCPYCSGHKVLAGYNDLATTHPKLVLDWDYRHNKRKPTEVSRGSRYVARWVCHKCGYAWESKVRERGISGRKCRKCGS